MRIGILTFHCAINYGAVLQCYALSKYLERLGHDVYVIDYRPSVITEVYRAWSWRRCKSDKFIGRIRCFLSEVYNFPNRRGRRKYFEEFEKDFLKCVPVTTIYKEPFDYIFVGSDQVWNFNLTKGFDSFYWGNFQHPCNTKLVSYAASMQDDWEEDENIFIKKYLTFFSGISVRESTLRDALQPLVDKQIFHVCDPTLLLSEEQWNLIVNDPPIKSNYVFLYMVNENKKEIEVAKSIAQKYGLSLVYLSGLANKGNSAGLARTSPSLMLGLIKNASLVMASSFHGTVFSLIFKKKFLSIRHNNGKDNRVLSLLKPLGLEKHFVTIDECVDCSFDLEGYSNYDLSSISVTGENFLKSILM